MTQAVTAVALLFDDTELADQLRVALQDRGARIVHEGGVSSLSRELLQQVGADVLVVNLDDGADDALDQLYEVIDGDHPRVVFNDAQVSRKLVGWDHARWARHLAVKVLGADDVDPPRPQHAQSIEVAAPPAVANETVDVAPEAATASAPIETVAETPSFETELSRHAPDEQHEQVAAAESESLAAELEALLAADEMPLEENEFTGSGLRFNGDEEPPPLHDGNFGAPATAADTLPLDDREAPPPPPVRDVETTTASVTPPAFDLDRLQLSPLSDDDGAAKVTAVPPPLPPAAATVRAPESWSLLDEFSPAPPAPVEKPDPAAFGIEKISAADFLAPENEQVDQDFEPVMSLELVSIEEAIAPRVFEQVSEMHLDDSGTTALSRLVLLGATADGVDSVADFLSAIPAGSRLTFLHTQRAGAQSLEQQIARLAASAALPVRLADASSRARAGEILVVPENSQVTLRRDGRVELKTGDSGVSIDESLSMAANAFGRDALAIVFAGRANDAVAGAQAIHDRGGQVWVESSSGEHFADMVSGIFAERLVDFSGTPRELAARLLEVFP